MHAIDVCLLAQAPPSQAAERARTAERFERLEQNSYSGAAACDHESPTMRGGTEGWGEQGRAEAYGEEPYEREGFGRRGGEAVSHEWQIGSSEGSADRLRGGGVPRYRGEEGDEKCGWGVSGLGTRETPGGFEWREQQEGDVCRRRGGQDGSDRRPEAQSEAAFSRGEERNEAAAQRRGHSDVRECSQRRQNVAHSRGENGGAGPREGWEEGRGGGEVDEWRVGGVEGKGRLGEVLREAQAEAMRQLHVAQVL